jgi:hypothetical protein
LPYLLRLRWTSCPCHVCTPRMTSPLPNGSGLRRATQHVPSNPPNQHPVEHSAVQDCLTRSVGDDSKGRSRAPVVTCSDEALHRFRRRRMVMNASPCGWQTRTTVTHMHNGAVMPLMPVMHACMVHMCYRGCRVHVPRTRVRAPGEQHTDTSETRMRYFVQCVMYSVQCCDIL